MVACWLSEKTEKEISNKKPNLLHFQVFTHAGFLHKTVKERLSYCEKIKTRFEV
jgi:hypothetical protein